MKKHAVTFAGFMSWRGLDIILWGTVLYGICDWMFKVQ